MIGSVQNAFHDLPLGVLRDSKIENPTTDRTEALPGIVGLSAFRFGPHEKQHDMRDLYEQPRSMANWAEGNDRAQ